MKKILIISGHTDLNDSVANKTILEKIEKDLPSVEITYLDKLYKDYKIDVKREQEKLLNADIIVFQFPMFWYSMPSLMHKYLEDVFAYGFSHGEGGENLKGKKAVISLTSGAKEEAYHINGAASHEITDYLTPLLSTIAMCKMIYEGYIYTGGVSFAYRTEKEKIEEMKLVAKEHAHKLIKLLEIL